MVLYPPVILVFFAMGAAEVLAGLLGIQRYTCRRDVRFGSKADMCSAVAHVRFGGHCGTKTKR